MDPETVKELAPYVAAMVVAALVVAKSFEYEVEYYENGQRKRAKLKYRGILKPEQAAKLLDIAADWIRAITPVSGNPWVRRAILAKMAKN